MVKEGYSELIAVEGAGTKSGEGNRIMGRPYSLDLRERVIQACEAGEESQAAPDYQQTSANLRRRYGIGGVRSATHANRGIMSANR